MAECLGLNAKGQPCEHPVVGPDGYCPAHTEGGAEHMREIAAKGGNALREKLALPGYAEGEVPRVTSLEEAKSALADIHVAVLTRRITDKEAQAATKAVAEWIKGDNATTSNTLVKELRAELDAKKSEIAALRKQLARPMKVAS